MPFIRKMLPLIGLGIGLTVLSLSIQRAMADDAGWRQMTVPVSPTNAEAIPMALYYPTQAAPRTISMGLFTLNVAVGAPANERVRGLIILSHGLGGSEFAHSSLAEALAKHGYLVAALRHPGDNWQDHSLLSTPTGKYFAERPAQVSRVIDALLADTDWKDRIASDAQGPRIAVLGHSAGGYTAVALAGGHADLRRVGEHCRDNAADDPIFCGMARATPTTGEPIPIPPTVDKRVRAAVALAPLGVVFTAQSLTGIQIPTSIYAGEKDRWLVPRFHAGWIAGSVPDADYHQVANAGHFAFMDPPSAPIPTPDGDAASDPPGFDRRAFLTRLQTELPAFFDKAFADQR